MGAMAGSMIPSDAARRMRSAIFAFAMDAGRSPAISIVNARHESRSATGAFWSGRVLTRPAAAEKEILKAGSATILLAFD